MKRDKNYMVFSVALAMSQIMAQGVAAEEFSYSGTTQISTDSYYLDINTFSTKLAVESVYVSAGDTVSEGTQLLKFTDESYQNAVSYYQASIIKAQNTLTDTQREYDNGILESQNTYDIAMADAENAEFIRDYQTAEVEKALKEHAEILEEIEDRISELYSGISSGSYGSSSSGGGAGGSGGSGAAGGQGSDSDFDFEQDKDEDTDEDAEKEPSTDEEQKPEGEPDSDQPGGENPGEGMPGEEIPGEGMPGKPEGDPSEDFEDKESLLKQIQAKEAELKETEAVLKGVLEEALQSVIQEEDDASSDYSTYREQLANVINQLEIDIANQINVRDSLTDEQEDKKASLTNSIEGDTNVLHTLNEVQEKLNKYSTVLSLVMKLFPIGESQIITLDTETVFSMTEYMNRTAELTNLYSRLVTLYSTENSSLIEQLEEEKKKNESQSGNQSSQDDKPSGGDVPSEEDMPSSGEKPSGSDMPSGGDVPSGSDTPSSGNMPSGSMPSGGSSSGEAGGTDSSGASGMSGFSGGSGMSGFSGSGMDSSGMSGSSAMAGGSMGQGMMGDVSSLDGSDISILGNSYDLSSVRSLLEREPSDSDAAYDLIDELEDSKEEVQAQYEELLRNERSYELQIQYTYDEAVLSGRLVEITYEQELKEWENTLQSAKDSITSLEEEQEILTTCKDGILLADRSGTLAAVNYDEEDTINPMTAIASYYKTDVVTIDLQVPQEEISLLQVGDAVDVTLGGRGGYEGIVSGKAIDPDSNTSKTDVKYTVTISIDNTEGRISSGTAATVTLKNQTGEE